jgi:hypothetical protein
VTVVKGIIFGVSRKINLQLRRMITDLSIG